VREGGRVNNDKGDAFLLCLLDAVDKLMFGICLPSLELLARLAGVLLQTGVDICQRGGPIDVRLGCAEQGQIRAIQE